jgi:hypothetical protein
MSRIQEYRRRRHRSAVRRRGLGTWKPTRECRVSRAVLVGASRGPGDCQAAALRAIGRRLSAYPGVRGLLYRNQGDTVDLAIVAPAPMTAPLSLLVATWDEEVRTICPACTWRLRVVHSPPGDADAYRCVFWR